MASGATADLMETEAANKGANGTNPGDISGHDLMMLEGDVGEERILSEDDDDEEEEEQDEPDRLEPVMDGRNITFHTSILNEFLVCPLCEGYFREPYTIRECLHTYCKSCIFKKLHQGHCACPECGVSLAPRPLEAIQYDRKLHEIVNKIFPDIIQADTEAEIQFYKERGTPMPASVEEKSGSGSKADAAADTTPERVQYKDEIQFRLEYDTRSVEKPDGPRLGPLRKPIITTSARVTVRHLKKFVSMELHFPQLKEIEVLYKDEVLGTEHTLEYILKSRGHPANEEPILLYRRRSSPFPH